VDEYEDKKSNWVPVVVLGPVLLAVALIVIVTLSTAVPAWASD
jgi:hypothetical protein